MILYIIQGDMQDARICRFMQYADGYMHQLIMYTSNKIKYARKLFNYHNIQQDMHEIKIC